jgi:hypothetical protein
MPGWEDIQRVQMAVHGQADLLEIVAALRPPGRFAGGLHGRQQQTNQDADDRDHDQQLDQRKTAGGVAVGRFHVNPRLRRQTADQSL